MFLKEPELQKIGFKAIGKNVLISNKCSIYGAENMSFGDNVRVDDFVVLSGKITFKSHIHIGVSSVIFGGVEGVVFEDFSALSSRCAVYAMSDDFSGAVMTNSVVPDKFKRILHERVIIGRHCVVGTGSTILPGTELKEGIAVGAMSLMPRKTRAWNIYFGIPARIVDERKRDLLALEREFLKEFKRGI